MAMVIRMEAILFWIWQQYVNPNFRGKNGIKDWMDRTLPIVRPVDGTPVEGVAGGHLNPHTLHQVILDTLVLLHIILVHGEQPHPCHACTVRMSSK